MAKGSRVNLDRILRSAWEVQRTLVLQQAIANSGAPIEKKPIIRVSMLRDTKLGYGFLFVGTSLPFLINSLFGIKLAIVVSVACLIVGIAFLWAGHHHNENATQSHWTLLEIFASGCAMVTLIAVVSIAALRAMPSGVSSKEAPKAAENLNSGEPIKRLPDLKWQYDAELYALLNEEGTTRKLHAPGGCNIVIVGEVSNLGEMASIARRWQLTVRMAGEQQIRATNLIAPGKKTLRTGPPGQDFLEMSFKDYLPEMTTTEPIGSGSNKVGFVVFAIAQMTDKRISEAGNTLTLGFEDVTGRAYKFDFVTTGARDELRLSIPGMTRVK